MDVAGARMVGVGVVQLLQGPAAVAGERAERVAAVQQQIPEVLGCRHAARKAAAHPHDGDGFGFPGLQLTESRTRLSQVGGDLFQEMAKPILVAHPVSSNPGVDDRGP